MTRPGSADQPLRVAVIGSGPAGFYTVQALQKSGREVRIDLFDRLPTPYGLVRFGVAPDHLKIKNVTAVYDKLAHQPGFRFFGNVDFGSDVTLDDLRRCYHQVVFATGAQTDRRLGIPGEDLRGSHPATEFVAWYNGHPDFVDCSFDLSRNRAMVVGVGNVAVDVARILCRTPEELKASDIAEHALAALEQSQVREVWLLGRRGPAQAAFTNPEVKELGEMADADAWTPAGDLELDPVSAASLEGDKAARRKMEILGELSRSEPSGKRRRLELRFLVSPVEILDDGQGAVGAVRLVRNELQDAGGGRTRAVATDQEETHEAGLVFRSVGYRGVPLSGVPFRDDWGIVPNAAGRVLESVDGAAVPGLYVSGWIKRGPSGVIGTNKPDAVETVACMLEDLDADRHLGPADDAPDFETVLAGRGVRVVSYSDWEKVDAHEKQRGQDQGRPRIKVIRRDEFLSILDRR